MKPHFGYLMLGTKMWYGYFLSRLTLGLAPSSNAPWTMYYSLKYFSFRSSEHLFENKARNQRSVSATPDREMGAWQNQRRASTSSNSSGTGIRTGGGLIETGRPVVQSFLPFGAANGGPSKKPNYIIRKAGIMTIIFFYIRHTYVIHGE